MVAAHGVGGTVGALLTGVFAYEGLNGLFDGALYGNPGQVLMQATAVATAIVYSGVVSFILLKLIGLIMPLRASSTDETEGLDITQHGEEAYLNIGGGGGAHLSEVKVADAVSQPMLKPARADV